MRVYKKIACLHTYAIKIAYLNSFNYLLTSISGTVCLCFNKNILIHINSFYRMSFFKNRFTSTSDPVQTKKDEEPVTIGSKEPETTVKQQLDSLMPTEPTKAVSMTTTATTIKVSLDFL